MPQTVPARLLTTLAAAALLSGCAGGVPAASMRLAPTLTVAPLAMGEPTAPAPGDPAAPRIASYNVYMPGTIGDLEARYEAVRGDEFLDAIDVWLLQEIETLDGGRLVAAEWIAERLGMHWAFAPTRITDDGDTHGLALLSRYPIKDVAVLWLPAFDLAWNSRDRAALAATIELPSGDARVYNVHLDTKLNFDERAVQLQPVVDDAAAHETAIIGGDFNSNSFIWVGRAFPAGFDNQPRRLDELMSSHGYATPLAELGGTSKLGLRLDSIYVRGLDVLAGTVHPDQGSSDHHPVSVAVAAR
jgi:endonuclease/exonuclease/phosphatase family metal-dependent hydrolase